MRSGAGKASDEPVYLRVKPGMEVAAAFLESRKYGAVDTPHFSAIVFNDTMETSSFSSKTKSCF
jgi:hypothetical protein